MALKRAVMCAAVVGAACAAKAQVIQWNFGTTAVSAAPSTDTVASVSGGEVTNGNCYGSAATISSTSASSGYAGASGTYNACVVARSNALNTASGGSGYFQFVLTPQAGHTLSVTNLSFGSRCTATGPLAYCVRSSLDGYGADLAAGALTNTGVWALKEVSLSATSAVAGAAVTFRLYGYHGTSSPASGSANWRIDDLTVAANAQSAAVATPPGLEQVAPQSVRAGNTLAFSLDVTPTDGDPVTYTNATASAGVTGAWSLEAGIFSYTPADADVGARSFTFDVADKDGTNAMTAAVTVRRRQVEAVRLTTATGSYAQDFDALASTGDANEWDNAALPFGGWYAYAAAAVTAYRSGTGSDTSGGLYSFGASPSSGDRALGSLASAGNDYRYGVAFTNETGQALTNLTVGFTAEQWRVGASASTNTLAFDICVTNRVLPLTQGVWRRVRLLCFDSPAVTNATQAAGAAYRSAARSATFQRPVPAGAVVLLRWSDLDDAGNDHALGIDDVSVTWATGMPPDAIPVGWAGVAENFDDLGASAAAELPWLWRVETRSDAPRMTGRYADASDRTANANAVLNFTWAGSYNFASSVAGDQSVGGLATSNASRTVTLFGRFRNATGHALRRVEVAYAVEKYRNGLTGCAVRLLSSTDGETWAEAGEPTAFAADADTNGYAADARPGASVAAWRTAALAAPRAAGEVFYLAWQISATEGESTADAQALGVDDIRVTPAHPHGSAVLLY
jgi:hypothetical protein